MKKILSLVLILFSINASAQQLITGKWAYDRLWIHQTLAIPTDTLATAPCGRSIAIKGDVLYFKNSSCIWQQITGGGGSGSSAEGIRKNGSTFELGDIAGANTVPLTVNRFIRSGNKSIYFQGNKTTNGVPNIILDDTLTATAGNPKFKYWMQFNSPNHVSAPFYIGSANVEDGAGAVNHVLNFGFNLSPSSTRVNPSYGAIGSSWEGNYQGLMEMHYFWIDKQDLQHRLQSYTIDTAAKTVDFYHSVSSYGLKSSNGDGYQWYSANGGNGSLSAITRLYAGTTSQYKLEYGFSVSGGNTSASISTDGPGGKEFHLDAGAGWNFAFLPSMFSHTTYNSFATQVLPATDGNIILGDVTNKWLKVNCYYSRPWNGIRIGNSAGDELPSTALDIIRPGSANGHILVIGTDNAGNGIEILGPNGGHTLAKLRAKTAGNYIPAYLAIDQDSSGYESGMGLETTSGALLSGAKNDFVFYNSGAGKNILFGTNSGSGRAERMRITASGNALFGTTTDNGARVQVNGDATVADDPYDATGWNGNLEVPTKNAIRDKVEQMLTDTFSLYNSNGRGFTILHPVGPSESYLRRLLIRVNGSVADTSQSTDSTMIADLTTSGGMAIGGTVTSGTSESVLYVDASNHLAQDNANFHYTPGTTTLFVPTLRSPTSTDLTLRAATSQKISFVTSGVERMAINVGGATVLNSGSDAYTMPSTRATAAGQVLTDLAADGSLSWTTLDGYNAQSGTSYMVLTSDARKIIGLSNVAARTITLPAANSLPAGTTIWFKDEAGTAGSANITINRAGSDTIDGATSYTINVNYDCKGVYTNGSSKWFIRF